MTDVPVEIPTAVRVCLAQLAVAVAAEGLRVLHLKGPVAGVQLFGAADARGSGDVDVLVHPEDVADLLASLERCGWVGVERSPSVGAHAVVLWHPVWQVTADVHLHFPGVQAPAEVAFEHLWRRRTWIELAGAAVVGPARTDHWVLLLLHAARGGGSDRSLADVRAAAHALASAQGTLPAELAATVAALEVADVVSAVLPDRFVGTSVQVRAHWALRATSPGSVELWLGRVATAASPGERLRLVAAAAFPGAAAFAASHGRPVRGRALVVAALARWRRGLLAAPAAWSRYRRAVRSARRPGTAVGPPAAPVAARVPRGAALLAPPLGEEVRQPPPTPRVAVQETAEAVYLAALPAGPVHRLEGTARDIWRQHRAGSSRDEIVAALSGGHQPAAFAVHVRELLDLLVRRGLAESVEPPTSRPRASTVKRGGTTRSRDFPPPPGSRSATPMNLEELLTVVRQRWASMTVIFVVVVLAVGLWTETRPREYVATASGVMSPTDTKTIAESYSGSILAQQMARSYLLMFSSRGVAEQVIDELDLPLTPESLIKDLVVTLPTSTVTVSVRATSTSPRRARDIANAVVRSAAEEISAVQGNPAGVEAFVRLVPVEPASLPSSASYPNRTAFYGTGVVAGLLLAALWGISRQRTDTRVRSLEEVEELAGARAIGVVPASKDLGTGQLLALGRTASQVGEAFRQVRTNLRYVDVDEPPKAIVVTSAVAGEGKSTVSASLAQLIAGDGTPVVLIDADLRRPTLHQVFGIEQAVGLTQVLAGGVYLDTALQSSGLPNLWVLTSGRIPHNPSELVGSRRMRSLIAELCDKYVVIIDTPPLLPVTDAALVTAAADGAILVCRSGRSRRAQVAQAARNLAGVEGRLLGLVINGAPSGRRALTGSFGYYAGSPAEPEYVPEPGRRRR